MGAQAIVQLQSKIPLMNSPAMEIFKQLVVAFDAEGSRSYPMLTSINTRLFSINTLINTLHHNSLQTLLLHFNTPQQKHSIYRIPNPLTPTSSHQP